MQGKVKHFEQQFQKLRIAKSQANGIPRAILVPFTGLDWSPIAHLRGLIGDLMPNYRLKVGSLDLPLAFCNQEHVPPVPLRLSQTKQ